MSAVVAALALLSGCTGSGSAAPQEPPVFSGAPAARAASPQHPNIVFILTDDLSSDLVRFMPGVQALAARGTSFSNYIVSDSLCCPSRTSIMTGQYPHDTGVFANEGPAGGFDTFLRLHDEQHTDATALHAAGYRTAFLGKYLNGYLPGTPQGPAASATYQPPGWDEWDGVGSGYAGFDVTVDEDGRLVHYPKDDRYYLTDVLQRRASAFMTAAAAQHAPYFLELATFTPHFPYVPAPQDRGTFAGAIAPRTRAFDRQPQHPPSWLRSNRPLTAADVRDLDRAEQLRLEDVQSIDRMVQHLEQVAAASGQSDDTEFVFSSDNGLHLGQWQLHAGKMTALDTDIRVPLIIAGPGVAAGRTRAETAQNIDLAPTFEQWAGASVPADVDGRSLLPLLGGATPSWPEAALVEHHGFAFDPGDPDKQVYAAGDPLTYSALRTPRFTYVRYGNGEREYYDLTRDPDELDNLAGALTPSHRQQLDRWLDALISCHGVDCRTARFGPAAAR